MSRVPRRPVRWLPLLFVLGGFGCGDRTSDLKVIVTGSGTGRVVSSSGGLDCSIGTQGTCTIPLDNILTLTATPGSNTIFVGWTGCVTDPSPVISVSGGNAVLTAPGVRVATCTATFQLSAQVTVQLTGSGAVSSAPAGLSCPTTCSASFGAGSTVTLTATPAASSVFAGWSGAPTCISPSNPALTLTVSASVTCNVRFDLIGIPGNQLPVVTIVAPAPDAQFAVHAPVTFTGTATDPEDGSLLVHWSLPQPPYTTLGQLATGPTFTIDTAQVGPLEIAAWEEDNNGGRDSTQRRVFVVFGGEIAFDIGETELRRSDGTLIAKLPDGGKPAWSPDGKRIAFVKSDGKDREIYIMNSDGTGVPVQVTNNTADDDTPAWAPDGLRLAYDSDSLGGQRDIFFKVLANGQVTRVTNDPAEDVEPAWCGTDILFYSDRDNDNEIYRQGELLNAAPKQLTINTVNDVDPHWSVDCSVIVFSHEEANGNLDVYLMNADGTGTPTNLTSHPANDRQPELSPDKLLIVFKSDRGVTEDLWFIRTTAPALPRIWRSTANAGHPRWKP